MALTALPSFGQPPMICGSLHSDSSKFSAPVDAGEDDINGNFEFSFTVSENETYAHLITADEIISEGHIRPIYHVFSQASVANGSKPRRASLIEFLIEDRDSTASEASSSLAEELEGISPETYCLWIPGKSPGRVQKNRSTRSVFRRWIRHQVPHRSNSDGTEKTVFLTAERKRSPAEADKKGKGKGLITAQRLCYVENCVGASRKSYLPYKPEIGVCLIKDGGCSDRHTC